jgi:hypothetical protein
VAGGCAAGLLPADGHRNRNIQETMTTVSSTRALRSRTVRARRTEELRRGQRCTGIVGDVGGITHRHDVIVVLGRFGRIVYNECTVQRVTKLS